jgi:hypothetical protein
VVLRHRRHRYANRSLAAPPAHNREHLIAEELDAGIAAAAKATASEIVDYVAAALPPDETDQRAGHLFIVEVKSAAPGAETFARELDAELASRNADYAAHRGGDVGMRPPRIRFVPPGTFAGWMASRGRLGGQNKVPRVIANADLLQTLLDFAARAAA